MMAAEMLALKFQELLGKQYKIFPNDAFSDKYTTVVKTELGQQLEVSKQAFEDNKGKIIGIVEVPNATRANVDFYLMNANYSVNFWVPVNFIKRDPNGILLESPKFNFYGDVEKLINKITNEHIDFFDDKYGRMTISEPRLSGNIENTGTGKRKVVSVSGVATITDKGIFGADTEYLLEVVKGEWVALEDVSTNNTRGNTESNHKSIAGSLEPEFDITQETQSLILTISDYNTDNLAYRKIKDAIYHNNKIFSPWQKTKSEKGKLHVRLVRKNEPDFEFWAVPEITYSTSKNGVGTFTVSFLNDNKE